VRQSIYIIPQEKTYFSFRCGLKRTVVSAEATATTMALSDSVMIACRLLDRLLNESRDRVQRMLMKRFGLPLHYGNGGGP
jgi:hypothetical protein